MLYYKRVDFMVCKLYLKTLLKNEGRAVTLTSCDILPCEQGTHMSWLAWTALVCACHSSMIVVNFPVILRNVLF